jgi:hypothetical protein
VSSNLPISEQFRLTFVSEAGWKDYPSGRRRLWNLKCECGADIVADANHVKRKLIRSCGCLRSDFLRQKNTTHGHSVSAAGNQTPEYMTWSRMIQRCHNPNNKSFGRYGAIGITVCDEWRDSFEAFLAHVGPRPAGKSSIDRIDSRKGYEPGNVRWSDALEQNRNRRSNIRMMYDGRQVCLTEYCELVGLNYDTVSHRLYHLGWPLGRAIEAKDGRKRSAAK